MRQIEINKLEKSLWEMYLQSGTGELGYTINRLSTTLTSALCVWPLEVRKAIFKKNKDIKLREEQLKQNDENQITTIYQIDNETCRTYTVDFISELNKRLKKYQRQLNLKKCYFKNLFTTQIEEMILKYIEEQEISFLRIENKTKLTIVQYDYKDKIIQAEFDQVKPSDCQSQLFDHFTKLKQDKDKIQYEIFMLKQRLAQNFIPEPLHSLQIRLLV